MTYATDLLDDEPVDLLDEWHHGDPVEADAEIGPEDEDDPEEEDEG